LNGKKILVVYYSRTGTTKLAADKIASLLGSETEEIVDTKNRTGSLSFFRCGMDATLKRLTVIREPKNDPQNYGLIIIGTPVWSHNMTPAVRTYVKQKSAAFKKVAFFCTSGNGSNERAFIEMEGLCGKKPVATLELSEEDVIEGNADEAQKEFTSKITTATRQP